MIEIIEAQGEVLKLVEEANNLSLQIDSEKLFGIMRDEEVKNFFYYLPKSGFDLIDFCNDLEMKGHKIIKCKIHDYLMGEAETEILFFGTMEQLKEKAIEIKIKAKRLLKLRSFK